MTRKRYAIVGLSGRSKAFTARLLGAYKDTCEIVALLDRNPVRMEDFNAANGTSHPCYGPGDFARMATETRPDAVIISTTDGTHHLYIIAALERDIEAITEKPMTTDEDKVNAILRAARTSRARVRVTHNYRYAPVHGKIRQLVQSGAVGRPLQIDFNYYLDTYHGSSYFKRWNRLEAEGGSLLVTKACHHFDLANWFLGQRPAEVFAYGALNYYGPGGPLNPRQIDGRRCSTCAERCAYFLRHASPEGGSHDEHLISFNNPGKNELFGAVDGYFADRCMFDAQIDTWDTFSLVAKYDGGAMMSYSLNASVPYEGYRLAINGSAGRIETEAFHGGPTRLPFPEPKAQQIRYLPLFDGLQTIEVINKGGGHGGADPLMMHDLFAGAGRLDDLGAEASHLDGAMAVLLGVAARKSLKTGVPVRIGDLLQGGSA
jgi:predicted dehydrogenase